MHYWDNNIIILIPSLEPDKKLPIYVDQLCELGLNHILVVDDGSGPSYQSIFSELETKGCVVLHHEQNQGKGCALKTGFTYIQENLPGFACVVTADADGQHVPEDVLSVADLSKQHPNALVLGVRDFSGSDVPPKSLIGNRISAVLFAALYGKYVPDTQTGLRAFTPKLLGCMMEVRGERFEYEIQMLITCVQMHIPILTQPIQVIYENQNKGTHFRPLRDSTKVIGTILGSFVQFALASLLGAVVDLGLAWILLDVLRPLILDDYLRILLATAAARVVSISVNYCINLFVVFRVQSSAEKSLSRYLLLSALLMLLSGSGVYVLNTVLQINEKIAKIICDTCLFLLSFRVQQKWVFAKRGGTQNGK